MNNRIIIYGLFNPITAECFYIGKTKCDLKTRLNAHIFGKQTNSEKDNIIKSIVKAGKKPIICELLSIEDYYIPELKANFWEYVERYFIKYTRTKLKEPIVNIAKGGEGGYGKVNNKQCKPVLQYDLKGNYIQTFKSISALCKYLNLKKENNKALKDAISGKHRYYKDYQYKLSNGKFPAVLVIDKKTNNNAKPVLKYDMNDVLLNEYESIGNAAKGIGLFNNNGTGSIHSACVGRTKTAYGFKWKFKT